MTTTPISTTLITRPATATWKRGQALAGRTTDRILEVVGPDGTVLHFMCADCGKTGPAFHSILGHLKAHYTGRVASTGLPEFIREHARLVKENERLSKRLKQEKAERLRVQRRLQSIERLFSGK